jgi:phosphoribosylanthranilate isomerase
MKPKIKICGVRRVADALLAVELGATHIGCVLAPDSPRCATVNEARELVAAVGSVAQVVLVFRNPTPEVVVEAGKATGIGHVQVHGVGEDFYRQLEARGLVPLRVYSMQKGVAKLPQLALAPTEGCPAFLDVGSGGSGRRFDWTVLNGQAPHATFIAGGVTPENASELLEQNPWGVDLSSGVESAPGVKDPDKLERLFAVLAEVEA